MSATKGRIIGIDLGTTHVVVASVGLAETDAKPAVFWIPQLTAAGTLETRPVLPAFRYHPRVDEFPEDDLRLPWLSRKVEGDTSVFIIGSWARALMSRQTGQGISSAKSWLSHTGIDQQQPVLPWRADPDIPRISPVVASASYLAYVRDAWDYCHPDEPMAEQTLILTVPASFDEQARQLTMHAARLAGLTPQTLFEEPQAALYAWLATHSENSSPLASTDHRLVVCDMGGGTLDFTLVRSSAHPENELPELERLGVGDHLMLGGDNMDLALAHHIEQSLRTSASQRFDTRLVSQCLQQARLAKEQLLREAAPAQAEVVLALGGSKLMGNTRRYSLPRDRCHQLILEGFFPLLPLAQPLLRSQGAIREFGLPWEQDPRVSLHLAAFIRAHLPSALPEYLLLSGGVFHSPLIRARVTDQLAAWAQGLGQPVPQILVTADPDSAIALGAVWFGMAIETTTRTLPFRRIRSGAPRTICLHLDEPGTAARRGICLLPRGTPTDSRQALDDRLFLLRVDRPVSFRLASSSVATALQCGDLCALDDSSWHDLPVLTFTPRAQETGDRDDSAGTASDLPGLPGGDAAQIEVRLETAFSETGLLEVDCLPRSAQNERDVTTARYRLVFPLSAPSSASTTAAETSALTGQSGYAGSESAQGSPTQGSAQANALPDAGALSTACELIGVAFGEERKSGEQARNLRNALERQLGPRDEWSMRILRSLADRLITQRAGRFHSAVHERVWLNLTGFCLRPGYASAVDPWRIDQVWSIQAEGLRYSDNLQIWSEWWTFWRRVAGGLDSKRQARLFADFRKFLSPEGQRSRKIRDDRIMKTYEDMVRLLAVLERLPSTERQDVADWLADRLDKPREPVASWWALGRLYNRLPVYAGLQATLPAETAIRHVQNMLKKDWRKVPEIGFATVLIARHTGHRDLDLPPAILEQVRSKLVESRCPQGWMNLLNGEKSLDEGDLRRLHGEAIPAGLTLLE